MRKLIELGLLRHADRQVQLTNRGWAKIISNLSEHDLSILLGIGIAIASRAVLLHVDHDSVAKLVEVGAIKSSSADGLLSITPPLGRAITAWYSRGDDRRRRHDAEH